MADSSDIENGIIARLGADAALLALCPNGAYYAEAPGGSTRFVIVSLVDESDDPMFSGRAFEDMLVMVKAVMLSTVQGADIKAAAARIDVLLEGTTLIVAGYSVTCLRRESRIRLTEVDDQDSSIRWYHRGGNYRVVAAAT